MCRGFISAVIANLVFGEYQTVNVARHSRGLLFTSPVEKPLCVNTNRRVVDLMAFSPRCVGSHTSFLQRPTTLVIPAVITFVLIVFLVADIDSRSWNTVLTKMEQSVPSESPEQVGVPAHHGVVLLTGLTAEKLKDFEGVEEFYEKQWNNRATYALAHGIHLFLTRADERV